MKKTILIAGIFLNAFVFGQHKFLNIPKLDQNDISATVNTANPKDPAEILFSSHHFLIEGNGFDH